MRLCYIFRERLQKLRKLASAKNGGNEVLAKLFKKQELVKKLAATQKVRVSFEVFELNHLRRKYHVPKQGCSSPLNLSSTVFRQNALFFFF